MGQKIYKGESVGEIERYLRTGDIIVLHGAGQVGKTSLLHYFEAEPTAMVSLLPSY
jgi:tRNA U34 5-carboxymethylaminomethyl modifying GTPase MnmE/TrmE